MEPISFCLMGCVSEVLKSSFLLQGHRDGLPPLDFIVYFPLLYLGSHICVWN